LDEPAPAKALGQIAQLGVGGSAQGDDGAGAAGSPGAAGHQFGEFALTGDKPQRRPGCSERRLHDRHVRCASEQAFQADSKLERWLIDTRAPRAARHYTAWQAVKVDAEVNLPVVSVTRFHYNSWRQLGEPLPTESDERPSA
jgi:hypothetical protein